MSARAGSCVLALAFVAGGCGWVMGVDFDRAHLAPDDASASDPTADAGSIETSNGDGDGSPAPQDAGSAWADEAALVDASIPDRPNFGTGTDAAAEGPSGAYGGDVNDAGADAAAKGEADSCAGSLSWQDVELVSPQGDRSVAPGLLSQAIGVILLADRGTRCLGAHIAQDMLLTVDCDAVPGDLVSFDVQLDAGQSGMLRPIYQAVLGPVIDLGNRYLLTQAPLAGTRVIPWEAREALPGEEVIALSHRVDSLARAVRTTLPASAFADGATGKEAGDSTAIFGLDGKLIAFCSYADCRGFFACISLRSLVATSVALRTTQAMAGPLWGDSTGDRLADGTVIERSSVAVRRSEPAGMGPAEKWVPFSYYGNEENLLADFDGDGRADLAVLNEGQVAVRTSNGLAYDAQADWVLDPAITQGILAGDVDGDRAADLLSIAGGKMLVRHSTRASFDPPQSWGSGLDGNFRSIRLVDVTGDGLSDLVVVRADFVEVRRSNGSSFGPPETWLSGVSAGAPGWFFADLTGDGAADAIVVDSERTEVFLSNGEAFEKPEDPWTVEPALGERGNDFADLTGDGKADAIVLHDGSIVVYRSTGTGFAPGETWLNDAFYGALP